MATSESSDEGYTVSRTRSSVTVHAPPPNSGPAVTSTGTPIPKTVAADADVVEQSIAASDELAPSNSTLQAPDPKTQSKLCGVCLENESKYKCARCLVPYCSVVCSTIHRATHSAVNEEESGASLATTATELPPTSNGLEQRAGSNEVQRAANSNGTSSHESGSNVFAADSKNLFSILDSSSELKTLFMMYPRLRSQLRDIYRTTLPPVEGAIASNHYDDLYQTHQRGRGGRGRGRGRGGRHPGVWNTDRGTQDGIDSLSDAKTEYGKGGEGVREYANLVLKLVSKEGIDVAKFVEDEVAQNTNVIVQLLNGESY